MVFNSKQNYFLMISVTFLLCIICIILFNYNKGYITEYSNNITILANGVEVDTFPSRESGFEFDGVVCVSGITGEWDDNRWALKLITNDDDLCIIYFYKSYSEDILNGADPVLTAGLIPVIISDDGVVKTVNIQNKWYDYETNQWANAVVVNDSQFRGSNYGKVIPMEAIEQMYVWIPRYEYDANSIESASNTIDITFVNTTQEAHPAFTFGNEELPGFWVGKFEQGIDNTIKPNQNSMNNLSISTLYTNVNNYNNTNGLGIDSDIHMIKSTEWGAIAYFSQSKYGICDENGICTSKVENNNYYNSTTYDITTGCGGNDTAVEETCPDANLWNTVDGQKASTTHNISGIYDLAGGRAEYVMGHMLSLAGAFNPQSSGFTALPDAKYYNTYVHSLDRYSYDRGITGDAIKELNLTSYDTSNWNDDLASMMYDTTSWMLRGGHTENNSQSGIWNFGDYLGSATIRYTTRSILTPINTYEYSYTGDYQTFTAPKDGYYQFEAWGAQGTGTSKGAYTSGDIELSAGQTVYVYVGAGNVAISNGTSFNGGTGSSGGSPGGGATDFRLTSGEWTNIDSLKSRIMVAAGSGSGSGNNTVTEGAGGTLIGYSGGGTSGGTQISFGAEQNSAYTNSLFGIANGGCAGGNGYYPGGGAGCVSGAGGGSSFISGYAGVNAILATGGTTANPTPSYNTIHYSDMYFTNGIMKSGIELMPTYDGTSTMTGNSGNGYAKITFIEHKPAKTNTDLDNVRYIKDCINGNSVSTSNIWVEIQAIHNGINIAKGKDVTGTVSQNSTNVYSRITDGNITSSVYASSSVTGLQCVTIDLGQEYDLDEVVVWHYYTGGRTFKSNTLSVGAVNETSTASLQNILINNESVVATSEGHRFSAYD